MFNSFISQSTHRVHHPINLSHRIVTLAAGEVSSADNCLCIFVSRCLGASDSFFMHCFSILCFQEEVVAVEEVGEAVVEEEVRE